MSNTGKSIFTFQDTQERKIFNSLVSSSFVFYIFSRAMKNIRVSLIFFIIYEL